MVGTGLIIVVSAPSGTGKSTVLNLLRAEYLKLRFSVSATTRSPRSGEVDGVNYHFKSRAEFEEMIRNNRLVEWDEYCSNYYGTPRDYIEDSVKEGFDIVLDITVEGAAKMKEQYPDSIFIFMLPPTLDELKRRIEKRGTETPESVNKRMAQVKHELAYIDNYDYIVINDDIPTAVNDMKAIITAEKLKADRNRDVLTQMK